LLGVIVLLVSPWSQKEGDSVTRLLKCGDVDGQ